jgi:hypothetical protein
MVSKLIILAAGLVLLFWLGIRFIIPLVMMHWLGVGVEVRVPPSFAKRHPALTIYFFNIGAPVLFLLILAGTIYLVLNR